MGVVYNRNNYGLFKNGDFRFGNLNFSFGTANTTNQLSGIACLQIVGGGGATSLSDEYVEVDTTKNYQMIAYARTISRGTAGTLAGGHLGFACFDQFYNFIASVNNGGIGNTTLSRQANPGDTTLYITSNASWHTGTTAVWRYINFFPATHPLYSTPYEYTRLFAAYNQNSPVSSGSGDFSVSLTAPLPDWGYPLPAGTPVSNGQYAGTYNYALGNPDYPETWTRYATPVFTGTSRNSVYPFRFGTKYVKFLVLKNYNRRLEAVQDHVWAIDRVFFGQVMSGRDYSSV